MFDSCSTNSGETTVIIIFRSEDGNDFSVTVVLSKNHANTSDISRTSNFTFRFIPRFLNYRLENCNSKTLTLLV